MIIGLVLDDSLDRPDGVQQYVQTIGKWLTTQGHEVHYLTSKTTRTDIPNVHSLGRVLRLKFNGNRVGTPLPATKRAVRKLLDDVKFDVLHVQMPYSPLLAGQLVRAADATTAVVGTFHILPYSKAEQAATKVLGRLLRTTNARFDHVLAVSEPAAQFCTTSFQLRAEVLPNAVDTRALAAKIKPRAHKICQLVFLGRLVERKGCLQLLKAIQYLHRQQPELDFRLQIAGDGEQAPKLKAFVRQAGLQDRVEFLGFVTEQQKRSLLSDADIAVFPSLGGESFGIVLIEAMAAGSGVVLAGNNPGYASVLGECPEQLIAPRNTAAFAAVLQRYIADPSLRRKAATWQQSHVKRYDVVRVGKSLEQIYARVLQSRRRMR